MKRKLGNILWRLRPRFGLRALLLAVTLICLWLGHEAERLRTESAALREVSSPRAMLVRRMYFFERRITSEAELRFFDTTIGVMGCIPYSDVESVARRLPNVRWITNLETPLAADYRLMTALQRKHPSIDFNVIGLRLSGGGYFHLPTEYIDAQREFFLSKGEEYTDLRELLNQHSDVPDDRP